MALSAELKEILACPVCLNSVRAIAGDTELECVSCGRRYPVRDGFPVMISEEATPPTREVPSRHEAQ